MWVLAAGWVAWADVPPNDGYVERCTVELACGPEGGEACDAWYGDPDACVPLRGRGLTFACRGWGASTWTEVWCRGQPRPVDQEPQHAEPRRRCGCDGGGATVGALGALALGMLLRRR